MAYLFKKNSILGAIERGIKDSKKQSKRSVAAPSRRVLDAITTGEPFPRGLLNLQPVETLYRDGVHTCYAFTKESTDNLIRELDFVNNVLDIASNMSGHEFGNIETVACTVPSGFWESSAFWGFTRVDYTPTKKNGDPSPTPIRLRFETSQDLCSAGSYSGSVWFDPNGKVKRLEVTEWVTRNWVFKVKASMLKAGLKIKEVKESKDGESTVIYKA